MDVQAMIETMTWDQFQAWQEYAAVEPFGEERADLRMGILASLIANVNRDPRKGAPFKAEDFMPRFGDTKAVSGKRVPLTDAAEWQRIKGAHTAALKAAFGVS